MPYQSQGDSDPLASSFADDAARLTSFVLEMAILSGLIELLKWPQGLQLYLYGFLLPIIFLRLSRIFHHSTKRAPEAPWLRISTLPGKAGEVEAAKAFVKNGHEVIALGYERVSHRDAWPEIKISTHGLTIYSIPRRAKTGS